MDVLYQVEEVPFCSYFVEHFYHERVLDFVRVFICICGDDQMVFALTLLLWCIVFLDFHILHQPGIPRVSPAWSWYIILFTCCWIQFGGILLRIFASIFIRAFRLVWSTPSSYDIFVWFWNQGSTGPHWMIWEVLHSILRYGSICKGFV